MMASVGKECKERKDERKKMAFGPDLMQIVKDAVENSKSFSSWRSGKEEDRSFR